MSLSARLIFKLVVPLVFAVSLASTRVAHAATCDTFVFDVQAFSCASPFEPNCLTTSGPVAPAPAAFVVRNDTSGQAGGPMIIQVQDNMGVLVYTSPAIPIGGELTLPTSLAGLKLITASNANVPASGWATSAVTINPAQQSCTPTTCSPEFVFDVQALSCASPFNPNCLTTSGPAAPTPAAFVVRNDIPPSVGGPLVIQVQDHSGTLVYTSPQIPNGGQLTLPGSLAGFNLITATTASLTGGWATSGVTINPVPTACLPRVPAVPWPALALLASSLAVLGGSLVKRKDWLRRLMR
jgi:hypothetical protein